MAACPDTEKEEYNDQYGRYPTESGFAVDAKCLLMAGSDTFSAKCTVNVFYYFAFRQVDGMRTFFGTYPAMITFFVITDNIQKREGFAFV